MPGHELLCGLVIGSVVVARLLRNREKIGNPPVGGIGRQITLLMVLANAMAQFIECLAEIGEVFDEIARQ